MRGRDGVGGSGGVHLSPMRPGRRMRKTNKPTFMAIASHAQRENTQTGIFRLLELLGCAFSHALTARGAKFESAGRN